MMLTKWRPFGPSNLHREMDQLFGTLRGDDGMTAFSPAVDIREEQERFVIQADLPGVDEEDIEVKVHEGKLMLSGKRELTTEQQEQGAYYRERRHGSFFRQFALGKAVNVEQIEATFKNGELTLVLPKREEIQPRQIKITSSN